jgi:hypothetical protein
MPQHTIRHKRYLVEYDRSVVDDVEDLDVFEVRVTTPDILDTELSAPTFGLRPESHSIAINVMWCFHAAKRLGRIPEGTSWPEFRRRCIDWQDLDRANGNAGVEVPPTLASDDSASDSPRTASEASTSTDGSEQLEATSGS